jgi:protein SCO1/2
MKLSKAVEKVKKTKEGKFYDLKTVFVSVDPDRDTNEKIIRFMKTFDENMIGVTGKSNEDPALR